MNPENVIGFEALYRSMQKCQKGVIWKDSVAGYTLHSIERTLKMEAQLHNGSYKEKPTKCFEITSPKKREIISIAFSDRIYQRSLNDNAVYEEMTRDFVEWNCACQQGKGTDKARKYMETLMREAYKRAGLDAAVAVYDVHGYYPNMRHDIAENEFKRKLDPWTYEKVIRILHCQYDGDKGYNPGSQLIQIAGISCLNGLDHLVDDNPDKIGAVRFMDDGISSYASSEKAERALRSIVGYMAMIGFKPNPKKTCVMKVTEKIPFMGYYYWITPSGQLRIMANPKKVKEIRVRLRRQVHACKRGHITKASVYRGYASIREGLQYGQNNKLIRRMDAYFKSLWEETNESSKNERGSKRKADD